MHLVLKRRGETCESFPTAGDAREVATVGSDGDDFNTDRGCLERIFGIANILSVGNIIIGRFQKNYARM